MSLHYLETHRLNNLLEEFKVSLKLEKEAKEVEKTRSAVIREIDIIISDLENLKSQQFI